MLLSYKFDRMTTKKKNKKQNDKIDIYFCTECGDQLIDFALEDRASDIESVRRNHELCKKTGKFKGECCSKLFIARQIEDLLNETEE
ncbi:MAG: hypothetical protein GX452_08820 [Ignavibacteriales bacterium]|jgi:hypothetical protein|nr:hypothetical protein [Ignavibacteriaceae bacterium]NLH61494.1 hypothetical protein [Ignavibacteriales bacterium]HOJ18839.1 hypothetical protein [Ignavibacteriaceae bacterium]HPO55690.1 hypothetical protein [Ignavibacteriaceae bacterium]